MNRKNLYFLQENYDEDWHLNTVILVMLQAKVYAICDSDCSAPKKQQHRFLQEETLTLLHKNPV